MQLSDINKVGNKTIINLNKLGIYNIDDLVTYYPYRFEIIKRSDMNTIKIGDKIIIDGVIETSPNVYYYNRRKNVMSFRINIESRIIVISIYNRAFLKNKLNIGSTTTVRGKYISLNKIVATDISLGALSDESKVEVIYHESSKINSKEINNYINETLESYCAKDYIPEYLRKKYGFISKIEALKEIHKPTSSNKLKQSINMLKYEELFLFMLKINRLRISRNKVDGLKRSIDKRLVDEFINTLPFKLTEDQLKSVDDIYNDLTSNKRMNRLIEGDVGSGKTIVAFISLYINHLSGYQGVLMAPTEVLANQHYNNIKKFMNINIEILTGSTKSKDKKDILKRLKNKEIDILIGTHSLFSDDVIYNNLGLVITDEQHRFGVNQRASLKNKGITPDILYLSATPIPRTYALTIYGDMDISIINTVPNGKKEIITILKKNSDIKDVLTMMLEELKKKHQIYVIAPLAEDSDSSDLESVNALSDKMNKALGKVANIGIMYGKMDTNDKDNVMNKFKNQELDILVSTTVIEVGVDVENATMIVIFDAERFGLSTLHQLRGRVGRNTLQSYCILVSDKDTERLNIMVNTNNGFKISEEDFKLRGSGDLFGVKQSGDMNFKLANIKRDFKLLLKAKEDSLEYLNSNDYNSDIINVLDNSYNLD